MVVTIADRSVTHIPVELQSPLQLEPCCHFCKATDKPLRTCSSCKLVTFCSKECQVADWARHKKEDECVDIKKIRLQLQASEAFIRANSHVVALEAIDKFGVDDAFLGREIPGWDQQDDGIMDLVAGRYYDFEMTSHYSNLYGDLYVKVVSLAKRYNTRVLWEACLEIAIEMNRISHMSRSDRLEADIVCILVKLHRDDDVISYLHYWLERQSLGPNISVDTNIVNSTKGEWPFPVRDGIRFTDILDKMKECNKIRRRDGGGRIKLPNALFAVALAIKLRHVSVYYVLSAHCNVFGQTDAGGTLPVEIRGHVKSFLVGGDTEFELVDEQTDHVMDYMDKLPQYVLPGMVEDEDLPEEIDPDKDKDKDDCLKGFLETNDGCAPVMATLAAIIQLWKEEEEEEE